MVDRFFLSPYSLKLLNGKGQRSGFLLKICNNEFEVGYADIMPWPEYGDPDVDQIPHWLTSEKPPRLIERSLELARLDGRARAEGIDLLEGLRRRNHRLLPDCSQASLDLLASSQEEGFERFKLKVARQPKEELAFLEKLVSRLGAKDRLRLDCNSHAEPEFLKELEAFREFIEFVEDPFADPALWQTSTLPLAYDQAQFEVEAVDCQWQVIKPAKQCNREIKKQRVVFTSYLDHPVGIAHALYQASGIEPQVNDYGLLSLNYYEPTDFHHGLRVEGAFLSGGGGLGIGFSDLLDKQKWIEV